MRAARRQAEPQKRSIHDYREHEDLHLKTSRRFSQEIRVCEEQRLPSIRLIRQLSFGADIYASFISHVQNELPGGHGGLCPLTRCDNNPLAEGVGHIARGEYAGV